MKVLLATPAHDGRVTDIYLNSIIQFIASANAREVLVSVLTLSGESLITRARNNIVADFLAGDWDYLFFVDGDIGFTPENAWSLLDSPYALTATPYPLKRIDWEAAALATSAAEAKHLSVETVTHFQEGTTVGLDGFAPALDAGTGFMCIHRSALVELVRAYPEKEYYAEEDGKPRWALFDTEIENGRYLSEDYSFCRLWQRLGQHVMVDLNSPSLHHRGLYEYGV